MTWETVNLLEQVRQACLFVDENGDIGVAEDVHIPSKLFSNICRSLNDAMVCGTRETSEMLEALESFIDLADNIERYGAMRSESDWLKVKSVRKKALSAIKNAMNSQSEGGK